MTTTILIPAGADTKYPAGLAQDAGLSGWEVLVFDNSQITANPATDGISNLFTLTPVGTATTDASGNWSVTGLPSGIYAIWLRDENSFYQMAQDILVRNPDNTYNTSQQDSLTKLGWTDILFRSIDASNGNVTDLNEQPIPNLGEVYGLNITYHASFVELFEFMSDTRPSCGLIGDGQGNSTCVVGRTYGLTIVTLVRPTARSPPYYLNCG